MRNNVVQEWRGNDGNSRAWFTACFKLFPKKRRRNPIKFKLEDFGEVTDVVHVGTGNCLQEVESDMIKRVMVDEALKQKNGRLTGSGRQKPARSATPKNAAGETSALSTNLSDFTFGQTRNSSLMSPVQLKSLRLNPAAEEEVERIVKGGSTKDDAEEDFDIDSFFKGLEEKTRKAREYVKSLSSHKTLFSDPLERPGRSSRNKNTRRNKQGLFFKSRRPLFVASKDLREYNSKGESQQKEVADAMPMTARPIKVSSFDGTKLEKKPKDLTLKRNANSGSETSTDLVFAGKPKDFQDILQSSKHKSKKSSHGSGKTDEPSQLKQLEQKHNSGILQSTQRKEKIKRLKERQQKKLPDTDVDLSILHSKPKLVLPAPSLSDRNLKVSRKSAAATVATHDTKFFNDFLETESTALDNIFRSSRELP